MVNIKSLWHDQCQDGDKNSTHANGLLSFNQLKYKLSRSYQEFSAQLTQSFCHELVLLLAFH